MLKEKRQIKFKHLSENDPIGISKFRYVSEISANEIFKSNISYGKRINVFSKNSFKCCVPNCDFLGTRFIKAVHKNGKYRYFLFSDDLKLMTVDHFIPVSHGGSDDFTNLQPMCSRCNKIKANMIITNEELGELIYLNKEDRILKVSEIIRYQTTLKKIDVS